MTDDDGEEDERGEAERYNDEHIAPKLAAIAEECAANGLYFVARVEWAPFEGQTTMRRATPRYTASHEPVYLASVTNGNFDAFVMNMAQLHHKGLLDMSQTMLAIWTSLDPFIPESKRTQTALRPDKDRSDG